MWALGVEGYRNWNQIFLLTTVGWFLFWVGSMNRWVGEDTLDPFQIVVLPVLFSFFEYLCIKLEWEPYLQLSRFQRMKRRYRFAKHVMWVGIGVLICAIPLVVIAAIAIAEGARPDFWLFPMIFIVPGFALTVVGLAVRLIS
jgi:magnesium-transporting ATPase (P-type)